LLGDECHGRRRIAFRERPRRTWGYRNDTLILETRHETATGIVCVGDPMPVGTAHRAVIRKFRTMPSCPMVTCRLDRLLCKHDVFTLVAPCSWPVRLVSTVISV
jgi:hypothetical protein